MTTSKNPGLPTADEVRGHAERWPMTGPWKGCGLWRATRGHDAPLLVPLRLSMGASPWPGIAVPLGTCVPSCTEEWIWTPCTTDGDPVELVERIEILQSIAGEASIEIGVLEKDLEDARVGHAEAERDRRIAELEENLEGAEATCDDEEAAHQETLDLLALRTNERDGLDTTLRLALADIERLGRERDEARAQLAERDAEIGRLRASHAAALEAGMQCAIAARAEIEHLECVAGRLRDDSESARESYANRSRELYASWAAMQADLHQALERVDDLEHELAEAREGMVVVAREAAAEIARLREKLADLQREDP